MSTRLSGHRLLGLVGWVVLCVVTPVRTAASPMSCPGGPESGPSQERPLKARERGDEAFEQQKWLEAAEQYESAIMENANDSGAWFRLGYAWHATGKMYKAIPAHTRATQFADTRATAFYNLACAFALCVRFDEAFEALDAAQRAGFEGLVAKADEDPDLEGLRASAGYEAWQRRIASGLDAGSLRAPEPQKGSSSSADRYLVLLRGASTGATDRAHRVIAERADGWWHVFDDAWIVGGRTSAYWLDELKPIVDGTSVDGMVVLALPSESEAGWTYYGEQAGQRCDWLHKHYSKRNRSDPVPTTPVAQAVREASGEVTTRKTWENAEYALGGDTYSVGVDVATGNAPRAVLSYRGSRMVVTRIGQTFQVRPYDNTKATCTVRAFRVDHNGVRIDLSLSGTTANPSSVFAGGHRNSFSGNLSLKGTWTSSGLRLEIEDEHKWEGLGNAKWEGRADLPS